MHYDFFVPMMLTLAMVAFAGWLALIWSIANFIERRVSPALAAIVFVILLFWPLVLLTGFHH